MKKRDEQIRGSTPTQYKPFQKKRKETLKMLKLEKSVGHAGFNMPIDVAMVQCLLKAGFTRTLRVKGRSAQKKPPHISVDGECTTELIDLIKRYQNDPVGMKRPDGRVDPMGKTFNHLVGSLKCTAQSPKALLFGPMPSNKGILRQVDPRRFRRFFPKAIGYGLTTTKGEDLLGFFAMLQKDPDMDDIRWAAYILATVYIETGFSFLPNEEVGKGKGKDYGAKKEVTDIKGYIGPKNAKYQNIYYGRGYCQLTHDTNYLKIGKAIGLGEELYLSPNKALDKTIAYKIVSYGMRNGTFTTHSLERYIKGEKCDYRTARKIINGLDRNMEIAGYAEKIELLLRLCVGNNLYILNDHSFYFC